MDKSRIFVGWAAVSSQPQATEEKISLTDQLYDNIIHSRRYGKMLCQLIVPGESRNLTLFEDATRIVNGWCIHDTWSDLTGAELSREIESKLRALRESETINPYAELKKLIDQSAFDVFVFRDLGRVGRDAALSLTVMRLCHRQNIITYATTTPPSSIADAAGTYHKSLLDAITAVGYENEIHQLMGRHQTGMRRRVENGYFPGRTPWGWVEIRDAKGKIAGYEIDEDAAKAIREIFHLYVNRGWGMRQIADRLNALGYPSPETATWDSWNVQSIVDRVWRYAGFGEINKRSKRRKYYRARGIWPAIIDEDLAHDAITERKSRERAPRAVSNAHRYSRLVFCATCGASMNVHNNVTKHITKAGEHKVYSTRGYNCHHGHGLVAESRIDDAMKAAIRLTQGQGDNLGRTGVPQPSELATTTQQDIETVNDRIAKVKAGIVRADTDLYVHGRIDDERHRMIVKAAQDELEKLYAELTRLNDIQHNEEQLSRRDERIAEIAADGMDMLKSDDIQMANTWFRRRFRVIATSRKVVRVEVI